MSESEVEELLTVRDIAQRLGITERTVFRWYTYEGMPVHRYGINTLRFRWSEVEDWASERANVAYPADGGS